MYTGCDVCVIIHTIHGMLNLAVWIICFAFTLYKGFHFDLTFDIDNSNQWSI